LQVEDFLEHSASLYTQKTAVVCDQRRVSYLDVELRANRFANALMAGGVRRGDRIVICLENCCEAAVSVFGALKAGAVFVVLDQTIKAERLHYILKDCGAAAIVISADKFENVREAVETSPYLQTIYLHGLEQAGQCAGRLPCLSLDLVFLGPGFIESAPPRKSIDADLAALIYTSGTSGRPKGVMLTHLNIYSASKSVMSYLQNSSNDIILSNLRLSYSYGLYQALTGFLAGATVVLERSNAPAHLLLKQIESERVTAFPIVPTTAALLLQHDLEEFDLTSLRYISCAGATLPRSHIRALRKKLPHAKLFVMYGQTECKRVSYLPPEQLDIRPDSVGIPIPNEEVFIVDEAGRPVDTGAVGELVVRGSHVMRGYWGLPEESKRVLRPGPVPGERLLYTGDLFRMDNGGYLYFVGRKDDMIKTRGERVSPKEIEDALYGIEGILEAAVVGVPDEILGQSILAVVTLRREFSISAQEILRHCARHLEDYKVPQRVEFRNSLPKTDRGKIDHRTLKVQLESTL
jgi:long-chain acyl-CoA synthetase